MEKLTELIIDSGIKIPVLFLLEKKNPGRALEIQAHLVENESIVSNFTDT